MQAVRQRAMSKHTNSAGAGHPGMRRQHGWLDPVIAEVDIALQVLGGGVTAGRPNPAGPRNLEESDLADDTQKQHAAGLMRVNHVGEICAQALYRGQASVCKDSQTVEVLQHAAREEVDHLAAEAREIYDVTGAGDTVSAAEQGSVRACSAPGGSAAGR